MTMVPIGDVAEVRGGGTPSKRKPEYYEGDIPWVTPKDMKVWEICDAMDKITPEAVSDSATKLIPPRSVLLVNRSGILKHTLPVGITRREVAINQDLKALICSDRAYPEYLAYIVKAAEPIILKWVRATTADNFPVDRLKELQIPLPPLDEQRRIAGILDQADALRRLRSRALDRLNNLGQAVFHEMFGERAAHDLGKPKELGTFLTDVTNGITRRAKSDDEATDIVLRLKDVRDGYLDFSEPSRIALSDKEVSKYILREGDLLFIRVNGNPDYVGRNAVFEGYHERVFFNDHIMRVRTDQTKLCPRYLSFVINSPIGKGEIRSNIKTSAGQHTINQAGLAAMRLPIPPIEQQHCFRNRLKAITLQAEKLSSGLQLKEELFSSLQHRAFKGEL